MARSTLLATEMGLGSDIELSDLDEREREVLEFLSTDQNAYFSFQGLRRRLGFHQETLTRTLKRLEEADVIERTPEGYKVKGHRTNVTFHVRPDETATKPIIDAYLPAQIDITLLFQKLRGRWFSNFRWLGYAHEGGRLSMSWISEDGQLQLQARIGDGKILITSDSTAGAIPSNTIAAAYQLFDHISKVAEEVTHQQTQPAIAN